MYADQLTFTVTARQKATDLSIGDYLSDAFPRLNDSNIDSVFGFVEPSTLYGGRPYAWRELSADDVLDLYSRGIGIRLPLTNKFVTRDEYEDNHALLKKYHQEGNAVITVSDDLATWIREDYPLYKIEASVIKELTNYEKIERAMAIYDTVVLLAKYSDDYAFLEGVKNKERITLFANAGCAYNCPSRICYTYLSRMHKPDSDNKFVCSKDIIPRENLGIVEFNLEKLSEMGFNRFKLLRPNPHSSTSF